MIAHACLVLHTKSWSGGISSPVGTNSIQPANIVSGSSSNTKPQARWYISFINHHHQSSITISISITKSYNSRFAHQQQPSNSSAIFFFTAASSTCLPTCSEKPELATRRACSHNAQPSRQRSKIANAPTKP